MIHLSRAQADSLGHHLHGAVTDWSLALLNDGTLVATPHEFDPYLIEQDGTVRTLEPIEPLVDRAGRVA